MKEFHTAKMELKPSRSSAGPERAGKISNAGDTASTLNEAPSEGNQSTTQGTHAYAEKRKIAIKDLRKNVNAGDSFKRQEPMSLSRGAPAPRMTTVETLGIGEAEVHTSKTL